MINKLFFPESPKNTCFKEISEDEALNRIFPQNIEKIEVSEDISLDCIYYLNIPKEKILTQKMSQDHKNKKINQKEKSSPIIDNFDILLHKYVNNEEINNRNAEKNNNKSPLFSTNLDTEKKIIDKEKFIDVKIENIKKGNVKNEDDNNSKNLQIQKKNIESNGTHIRRKYRSKKRNNQILITDEKYFPFTRGKGIIFNQKINNESLSSLSQNNNNTFSQFMHENSTLISKEDLIFPYEIYDDEFLRIYDTNILQNKNIEEFKYNLNVDASNLNDNYNFNYKFTIKKYMITPTGKKKKMKKTRKFKPDNIRKKIKTRFHKIIKNIINKNLKKVGSKKLFDFIPQCFIGNISKKVNSKFFESTYKELLSTDFIVELNREKYRNSQVDHNKYLNNLKVLNYLEKNPDICKRSGFDLIKDRKYKDILKNYFSSAEFENSLIQLKTEKESPEYILEYMNRAKNYIDFYSMKNNNIHNNNEFEENNSEWQENEDDENIIEILK